MRFHKFAVINIYDITSDEGDSKSEIYGLWLKNDPLSGNIDQLFFGTLWSLFTDRRTLMDAQRRWMIQMECLLFPSPCGWSVVAHGWPLVAHARSKIVLLDSWMEFCPVDTQGQCTWNPYPWATTNGPWTSTDGPWASTWTRAVR